MHVTGGSRTSKINLFKYSEYSKTCPPSVMVKLGSTGEKSSIMLSDWTYKLQIKLQIDSNYIFDICYIYFQEHEDTQYCMIEYML